MNPKNYSPIEYYYPTNPCAAICEFYGIDWDHVCWLDWSVPYGETREHTLDLPHLQRGKLNVHISLYRMPSGTYEALSYRC